MGGLSFLSVLFSKTIFKQFSVYKKLKEESTDISHNSLPSQMHTSPIINIPHQNSAFLNFF